MATHAVFTCYCSTDFYREADEVTAVRGLFPHQEDYLAAAEQAGPPGRQLGQLGEDAVDPLDRTAVAVPGRLLPEL